MNAILYLIAAFVILLLLFVLTVSFPKTRRFSMVVLMIMGLVMIGCGVYFALQASWRTIGYLLLVAGGVVTLVAVILFKVWKKRPLPPPPAPAPGSPAPNGPAPAPKGSNPAPNGKSPAPGALSPNGTVPGAPASDKKRKKKK